MGKNYIISRSYYGCLCLLLWIKFSSKSHYVLSEYELITARSWCIAGDAWSWAHGISHVGRSHLIIRSHVPHRCKICRFVNNNNKQIATKQYEENQKQNERTETQTFEQKGNRHPIVSMKITNRKLQNNCVVVHVNVCTAFVYRNSKVIRCRRRNNYFPASEFLLSLHGSVQDNRTHAISLCNSMFCRERICHCKWRCRLSRWITFYSRWCNVFVWLV